MVNSSRKLRVGLSKTIGVSLKVVKLVPEMGFMRISTTWNLAGIWVRHARWC